MIPEKGLNRRHSLKDRNATANRYNEMHDINIRGNEGAIKNSQSGDTDYIGRTRHMTKTSKASKHMNIWFSS